MNEPTPQLRTTREREVDRSGAHALSSDFFELLMEANKALLTLPTAVIDCPEVRDLGIAVHAGNGRARRIIEQSGGVAIAGKLMEASGVFRSTGHFRQCSMLERCAFTIAGWERRRHPRRG